MVEQRQLMLKEVARGVTSLRTFLHENSPNDSHLLAGRNSLNQLSQAVRGAQTDSFYAIAERLEQFFSRFVATHTAPNKLEREAIELASDWLEELASLYAEEIPEPRSLVSELLYTFDLVERSQGAAASLVELLASHETAKADLFLDDPEIAVDNYRSGKQSDPFGDDPGFGLEFDLLQRTLNRLPVEDELVDDPFAEDPLSSNIADTPREEEPPSPPYDVFADDPPPV